MGVGVGGGGWGNAFLPYPPLRGKGPCDADVCTMEQSAAKMDGGCRGNRKRVFTHTLCDRAIPLRAISIYIEF